MQEEDYRRILAGEPGNAVFGEYARMLIEHARPEEALLVCLKGLSSAPGEHRGRLMLARALYELGAVPFAVREVEQLCAELPQIASLKTLLLRLAPGHAGGGAEGEGTVAEMDLSFDQLDPAGKPGGE